MSKKPRNSNDLYHYEEFKYTCEATLKNGRECGRPAISRWYHQDEEGDGYETYRCTLHPETDPDYHEQEV